MMLTRLWHAIAGHDWRIHLVDEHRAVVHMQFDTLAGTYSTCRCGATYDDLSEDARLHFIRTGRLLVDFASGGVRLRT